MSVDPRPRELAEKLVHILNQTTDSHAVIVVTATLRGALGAAWEEGYVHGCEAEPDRGVENPFTRGCV